ncbi:amidase family protein [Streptomyces sp. NBC_01198]|uniref:amidase family protein n=1 Tax=Streptomyces sp. NBC_01198 TaxID=2903769 RepID=UPI002E0DD408|nr:amidase family protein [Streptomyces sp. NBC_01198]
MLNRRARNTAALAGNAAAASAGLAAVAIGTETSGSILSPAANSDVGVKPTVGLVSRTGIVPARTLADVIAYNAANSGRALKFGQVLATASQAMDLSPGSADTAKYLADRAQDLEDSKDRIDRDQPEPLRHRGPLIPPAPLVAAGLPRTR